jgi:DNA-binding GntR family transcriptional regulator
VSRQSQSRPRDEPLAGDAVRSINETITERLRWAVISGELPPGERIQIRELEELFGVSHIPIREALRRIEAEDLVQTLPRRGVIATSLSTEKLHDIYFLRRVLEPAIAERAATAMSEDTFGLMEHHLAILQDATKKTPASDAFISADRAFHWSILGPGSSQLAERVIRQLWQLSERYVRLGMTRHGTPEKTMHQHEAIVDAMRRRNRKAIHDAVTTHLELTEEAIDLQALNEGT